MEFEYTKQILWEKSTCSCKLNEPLIRYGILYATSEVTIKMMILSVGLFSQKSNLAWFCWFSKLNNLDTVNPVVHCTYMTVDIKADMNL